MTTRSLTAWISAVILCAVLLLTPLMIAVPAATASAASTPTASSVKVSFAMGDINGDYAINILDAINLYNHVSGQTVLPVAQLLRADVDGGGSIDILDAILLYNHAANGAPITKPSSSTTTTTTTTTVVDSNVTTTTTTATDTTTTTNTTTTTSRYVYTGTTVTGTSTLATTSPTALLGIDVSYAQGTVDWLAVSETDVDFAILRCGYGQDDYDQDDAQWKANVAACEEYGIPYGVYFMSYARNDDEAYGEAMHALRLLEGKDPTYPVFYDMEYSEWQGDLTPEQYARNATIFCDTLAACGYKVGVYSNLDWWRNRLTDDCFDRWYRWVAQYNDTCDYTGTYHIWQYTQEGEVDGTAADPYGKGTVDMNYCYVDFTTVDIKAEESDDAA